MKAVSDVRHRARRTETTQTVPWSELRELFIDAGMDFAPPPPPPPTHQERFLAEVRAWLDVPNDHDDLDYETKSPSGYLIGEKLLRLRDGRHSWQLSEEQWAILESWGISREVARPKGARKFWRYMYAYLEAGNSAADIVQATMWEMKATKYGLGMAVCNIRYGDKKGYEWFNDDDRREWDRLGIPWTGKKVMYENQDKVLAVANG